MVRLLVRRLEPSPEAVECVGGLLATLAGDSHYMREIAEGYNDMVIYPDKVRLNCYYYRHYSFVKDIQMIFCTVLGRKMKYAGEEI